MDQPLARDEFSTVLRKRLSELSNDLIAAHVADLRARGFKPHHQPQETVPLEKPIIIPHSRIATSTSTSTPVESWSLTHANITLHQKDGLESKSQVAAWNISPRSPREQVKAHLPSDTSSLTAAPKNRAPRISLGKTHSASSRASSASGYTMSIPELEEIHEAGLRTGHQSTSTGEDSTTSSVFRKGGSKKHVSFQSSLAGSRNGSLQPTETKSITRASQNTSASSQMDGSTDKPIATVKSIAARYSERQLVLKYGYSSRGLVVEQPEFSTLRTFVRRMVLSNTFDGTLGVVIILNAILMGVETFPGVSEDPKWTVIETSFLVVYTLELTLRVFAVGFKAFFRNPWMLFDCFLVVAGWIDTTTSAEADASMGKMLRFFRLQRLARLFRLCFIFQNLWSLIEGLFDTVPFLFWTSFLVLIIIYVYSLAGMDLIVLTSEHGTEYEAASRNFEHLGMAMLTLLQLLTLDSIGAIYRPIIEHEPLMALYFISFMLLVSIALVNLVTAKMVEVTQVRASRDVEAKAAWQKTRVQALIPAVRKKFEDFDSDGSGGVPLKEFLDAPDEVQDFIVSLCHLRTMEDIFKLVDFDDDGVITADEFISGVIAIHEGQPIELIRLMKQSQAILTCLQKDVERRSTMLAERSYPIF